MGSKGKVAIVGAGLSGLSCAYYLEQLGYAPSIYELNAFPGGRIATDKEHGFLFDHGFQVLLSSYSEVKEVIDWGSLQTGKFFPGARVWYRGQWHLIENPLRNPLKFFKTSKLPFVKFSDLWTLAGLYLSKAFRSRPIRWEHPPVSTAEFLKQKNISEEFIHYFIKPFFGGVFLQRDLNVSSEVFLHVLRFFAEGIACLPKEGMQAVPKALAKKLRKTKINYKCKVAAVEGTQLFFNSGQEVKADKIVIATDLPHARELLPKLPEQKSCGVTCLYFALDAHLFDAEPILYLNGSAEGPINNLAFLNAVQPSYAPSNQHLVSVSVIDPKWKEHSDLKNAVVNQLESWFKIGAAKWKYLRAYQIAHALPDQKEPPVQAGRYQTDRLPDVYVAGELVESPASINSAIASGRKLAAELDKSLGGV